MAKMTKQQIEQEAERIKFIWIAKYGLKRANWLSLAVRRKIREKSKK